MDIVVGLMSESFLSMMVMHGLGWFVLSHLIALIFYGQRNALNWKHCAGNGIWSALLHWLIQHYYF